MSDTQPKAPEQLTVNEQGGWEYPSGSSSSYVEIELPSLPGSINPTERLHMRDFGGHVVGKIESSMNTGYLRQQSPTQVFRHYVGCAEGASLLDSGTLGRMKELATEFESVPERDEYYKQVVRPWLHSLAPKRR